MAIPIRINAPIQQTLLEPQYDKNGHKPPVRDFDTVYQNVVYDEYGNVKGAAPRFVSVCVGVDHQNTQGAAIAFIGKPPEEEEKKKWQRVAMEHCSWYSGGKALWATLVFRVPPGWYYKVEKLYDLHLYDWIEQDIWAIYA